MAGEDYVGQPLGAKLLCEEEQQRGEVAAAAYPVTGESGDRAQVRVAILQVPAVQYMDVDCGDSLAGHRPDSLSLCCCPLAAIYNHEGFTKRRPIFLLPLVSLVVLVWFQFYSKGLTRDFVEANDRFQALEVRTNDDNQQMFAAGGNYMKNMSWAFLVVVLVLLSLALAQCAYGLCMYRAGKRAMQGPTLLGRLCCALPTVYYWERNSCNEKALMATCLGPLYTLLCYNPSYGSPQQRFSSSIV